MAFIQHERIPEPTQALCETICLSTLYFHADLPNGGRSIFYFGCGEKVQTNKPTSTKGNKIRLREVNYPLVILKRQSCNVILARDGNN